MKKGSRTVAPRRLVCWTAMLLTALGASLARLLGVPAAASWLRRQPARRRRRPSPTRSASVCGAAADEDTDPALPAALLRCGSRPAQAQAREASEQSRRCWEAHWRPSWGTAAQANMTATAINLGSESVDSIAVESLGEDFEFDAVVPALVTSTNTAARLKSIRKYIRPRVRNIYLLVESDVSCRYLTSLGPHVYCLPVHALSGRSGVEMVAAYPHLATSGRHGGWFAQQFAKLFVSLIDVGLSDHFAVIDSDNIFPALLRPSVRAASIRAPTAQFFPLEWAEGNIRARLQTKTYSSSDPVLRAVFVEIIPPRVSTTARRRTTSSANGPAPWPTAARRWRIGWCFRGTAYAPCWRASSSAWRVTTRPRFTTRIPISRLEAAAARRGTNASSSRPPSRSTSSTRRTSWYITPKRCGTMRRQSTNICATHLRRPRGAQSTSPRSRRDIRRSSTRPSRTKRRELAAAAPTTTASTTACSRRRSPPNGRSCSANHLVPAQGNSNTRRSARRGRAPKGSSLVFGTLFHEGRKARNQFLMPINALRRQDDLINSVQVNKITKETTILINAIIFSTRLDQGWPT